LVSFSYWGVVTWLALRDSVTQVYELFDAHLVQTSLALLRVSDPDENGLQLSLDTRNRSRAPDLAEVFSAPQPASSSKPSLLPWAQLPLTTGSENTQLEYERHLRYQVWNHAGELVMRSANASTAPLATQDGFSESVDADGHTWRHYALWDTHTLLRIVVSEDHELRNQLVRGFAMQIVSPLALGLPALLLLLWVSIHRGLRPLGLLTRDIARRRPDNLTPLDPQGAPQEVRGMVEALNALLHRVSQTLDGERRFTANAAHELRTPLAALQAYLHLAQTANNVDERQQAMRQMQLGVERSFRVVGQMLNLARLDPEQTLPHPAALNLGEVAINVCAALAPLALQRQQTLDLDVQDDLPAVMGNADMLTMLVSNLVDNAIRYTPQGGQIRVWVQAMANSASAPHLRLLVQDDGPGIPAAQRERVFERFVRLAAHETEGTGLGLAICRRIAQLHAARVEFCEADGGCGLCVRVDLPIAPA
jgi:two-component system sensor histidine kinase QseC